jgi:hypothetical protein
LKEDCLLRLGLVTHLRLGYYGILDVRHVGSQVQDWRYCFCEGHPEILIFRGGAYVVTATLPERDGEFEYREPHERVMTESELSLMP